MPHSMPAKARWSLEPYAIGTKLRALRSRKRLTLARLADETGLSTAMLSKLETDRMTPTLPTLALICRVYGVGLSYFFQEPEGHTFSITRKASLQGNSRGPEPVRAMPLNSTIAAPRLAVQMMELAPGVSWNPADPGQTACGMIYVVDGRLQLDAGGAHEMLDAGDCAYIESRFAVAWSAAGKHPCRILWATPSA
ncbi:MAG TPA: helix-turn-helix domain-containing protein [Terracidiphilus sp.]|nr:helix-turn-helix domain-containing protein [Terracidiphilus sp.]